MSLRCASDTNQNGMLDDDSAHYRHMMTGSISLFHKDPSESNPEVQPDAFARELIWRLQLVEKARARARALANINHNDHGASVRCVAEVKQATTDGQDRNTGSLRMINLERSADGTVGIAFSRRLDAQTGPFTTVHFKPGGAADLCRNLFVGDLLHAVDGTSVHNLTIKEVESLIVGAPTTSVLLTIQPSQANFEVGCNYNEDEKTMLFCGCIPYQGHNTKSKTQASAEWKVEQSGHMWFVLPKPLEIAIKHRTDELKQELDYDAKDSEEAGGQQNEWVQERLERVRHPGIGGWVLEFVLGFLRFRG